MPQKFQKRLIKTFHWNRS